MSNLLSGVKLAPGSETHVTLTPKMISDAGLDSCKDNDIMHVGYIRAYSQKNCEHECISGAVQK